MIFLLPYLYSTTSRRSRLSSPVAEGVPHIRGKVVALNLCFGEGESGEFILRLGLFLNTFESVSLNILIHSFCFVFHCSNANTFQIVFFSMLMYILFWSKEQQFLSFFFQELCSQASG